MGYPDKIELILTYRHDPADTEIFTERVDAEKAGEYHRLIHVPAFAPNIAYGDIVKVEFDEGEFHFEELIEESGFSVAHIIMWKLETKDRIISVLNEFDCGVNTHIADDYIVISIPPQLLYSPIRMFLLNEKSKGNIDFGDWLNKVHADNI